MKTYKHKTQAHRSEWRGQTFDQKLLNSHFYACEVKMCTKLAYPVVKSPTS